MRYFFALQNGNTSPTLIKDLILDRKLEKETAEEASQYYRPSLVKKMNTLSTRLKKKYSKKWRDARGPRGREGERDADVFGESGGYWTESGGTREPRGVVWSDSGHSHGSPDPAEQECVCRSHRMRALWNER